MSYQITIKQTREAKKIIGKQWAVIGTEETPRQREYWEKDQGQPKTRIQDVHGYTPEVEATVTEEIEVLKQTVDTLDLPAVIKAINGL